MPIYIGGPEAAAIHYALEGIEPARPLTHDLSEDVLDELACSLDRVVVTEVRDRTYFAELHLRELEWLPTVSPAARRTPSPSPCGSRRPSSPRRACSTRSARSRTSSSQAKAIEDELLEDFRDFIENVKPEDFEAP